MIELKKHITKEIITSLTIIFLIIVSFILCEIGLINKYQFGLKPLNFSSFYGIFTSIFIHSNLSHLASNIVSLTLFLLVIALLYKENYFKILIFGYILTGLTMFIFAREANHIGVSGLIYFLFSFLLFNGLIRWYKPNIAISLILIFVYNSLFYGLLPVDEKISWDGHLSGFVIGIIAAFIFKSDKSKPKYDWEDEPVDYDINDIRINYKNNNETF